MKKITFYLLIAFFLIFTLPTKPAKSGMFDPAECGEYYAYGACNCENQVHIDWDPPLWCCGWYYDGNCQSTAPAPPPPTPTPTSLPTIPPANSTTLDSFNPLKLFSSKASQLSTPGGIISEILRFAFPMAGIILFVMLIVAGLKMLTGATNSKNMEEGKQMIGAAILGFIILFAAYWIAQLLEIIFGIIILG